MVKKIFFITLIGIVLTSCVTVRVEMGMSQDDFTKKYHSAELVSMTQHQTIYKMQLYNNGVLGTKFFYFVDGKLVQFDSGVRQPDVVIQTQTN